MRTIQRLAAALCAAGMSVYFLSCLGAFPWSPINCTEMSLDLNTGRIKRVRYVLWLPLSTTLYDTILTKALPERAFDGSTADWQTALTLSPGVKNSPTYVHMDCLAQLQSLDWCWQNAMFDGQTRRICAEYLLKLWRDGLISDARRFLDLMHDHIYEHKHNWIIDKQLVQALVRQVERERTGEGKPEGKPGHATFETPR